MKYALIAISLALAVPALAAEPAPDYGKQALVATLSDAMQAWVSYRAEMIAAQAQVKVLQAQVDDLTAKLKAATPEKTP